MTMKKIELKVGINCRKCKTEVMKAVTKLKDIDQVAVDAEKGLVTVIGEADPVRVTKQIRKKTGKFAEIISVGPPKKPDPPKKPETPPAKPVPLPPCCPSCQVVVGYDPYEFGGGKCTIL